MDVDGPDRSDPNFVDPARTALMVDTREFVVVHEVAHQWWSAVVGSDSKRHAFLDEALANFSAALYFEVVHGDEAATVV